ncbi:MAG TPA: PepSY domain-containing protein [Novosphingobium sp.]
MPASNTTRRKSAPGHIARRWLYLTHRWIGIASCLLFAMWFASGLVMIYVPYPSLAQAERVARLDPIAWPAVTAPVPDAAGARTIALEMRDHRPIWRVAPWEGAERRVPADDGPPLAPADAALARRVAARFGGAPVARVEAIVRDQWTVAQRFDRHRPLWKATLRDAGGTELYVSSATGDVVQDTRRGERFWNWLGSVPHWIYPTVLRQDGGLWRQVVLWVAGPCIAAAVTGLWIGILRVRLGRRRFKGGRMTPYRGWMLWHHVAGLAGGVFLVAWIFSGWLSVDPGRVFHSEGLSVAGERSYAGALVVPPDFARDLPRLAAGAVRVELAAVAGGRPLLRVIRADGGERLIDPRTRRPPTLSRADIVSAAVRLLPGAPVARVERLSAPDAYWYGIDAPPRLPVLRLRLRDAAATWVHLDPVSGEVLGSIDTRGRAYRWLFDLLHKWDLNALTARRPLWDIWLWVLSLLGVAIAISGVRIGWKRLRA